MAVLLSLNPSSLRSESYTGKVTKHLKEKEKRNESVETVELYNFVYVYFSVPLHWHFWSKKIECFSAGSLSY